MYRTRHFPRISYADALENYRTNTDWWIVFDSFELPNAIGSALWIAGRTGLSVDTVTEALEGLVVLGLVKRIDKGFEAVKNVLHVPTAAAAAAALFLIAQAAAIQL